MNRKEWHQALEDVNPYIFKILTPTGSGTGFQISCSKHGLCGIATAYHVIEQEYYWKQPIKLVHYSSKKEVFLNDEDSRAIFVYPDNDLAFILFNKQDLPIMSDSLDLVPPAILIKQGVEIGWCGFPSVAPDELCFFAGHISAYLDKKDSYLVDGVAINGVSGGPALHRPFDGSKPRVFGVITAYLPNRVFGETLPGVSFVRNVEPYRKKIEEIKSLDEAEEKAKRETAKVEKPMPIPIKKGIEMS